MFLPNFWHLALPVLCVKHLCNIMSWACEVKIVLVFNFIFVANVLAKNSWKDYAKLTD